MYEFKLYPVLDFLLSPLCITAQWFTCLIDLALTSKPWLDLLSGYKRLSNESSTATESCIGCLWHSENNFHHWYPVRSILQTCDIFGDQAFLCLFQKKLMQSNVVLHVVMLTIHLCIKAGTNSQEKMEIDKIWSCFIFMGNRISTISISPIFFWQSLAAVLACLWHSGKHTHPILSRKLLSFKWDHSHPDLACRLGVVAKLSSFGSP